MLGPIAIDARVLAHRGPKPILDPEHAYATTWEEEADGQGGLASTAVVFLTNRECPFRCVMCDLWMHTLDTTPPAGAVPRQIARALAALPPARWVKLYNAGSFFDPGAIPREDDAEIARRVAVHDRVIVESHPAFLAGAHGERCVAFRDRLSGALEVAIGLETAHPDVLARLNKRMTLAGFRRAADFLAVEDIAMRVFLLLNPPFLPAAEGVEWACRSIDVAAASGARVCTVIPTRGGNGALEALAGPWEPPRIAALEAVVEYGLSRGGPVVLADLWDIERFVRCPCDRARVTRLAEMNRTQTAPSPVVSRCDRCM
jgi:radical SAM enzyme (TIGR01210 family)